MPVGVITSPTRWNVTPRNPPKNEPTSAYIRGKLIIELKSIPTSPVIIVAIIPVSIANQTVCVIPL